MNILSHPDSSPHYLQYLCSLFSQEFLSTNIFGAPIKLQTLLQVLGLLQGKPDEVSAVMELDVIYKQGDFLCRKQLRPLD